MDSYFEVVDYRTSDDMIILYGCIEMTDFVKDYVDEALPLIIDLVKSTLQLDVP
jgi:hypothetical protein